jgi:hypothetical protein
MSQIVRSGGPIAIMFGQRRYETMRAARFASRIRPGMDKFELGRDNKVHCLCAALSKPQKSTVGLARINAAACC